MTADFDLIVVGAGSAGSAIAARVSEDPAIRVLLLEAGPDYPSFAELPEDLRNGNDNSYTAHDWGFTYRVTPDAGVQPFPRGKVIGGSSSVNTCIALRGEPGDYDEWASIAGEEWTWDRCLPAFVRLETDHQFADAPYHGADGPVPIRRYVHDDLQPIQAAFLEGCRETGLQLIDDHNAPGASGAGLTPLNKDGSSRISMATAYLDPARSRENLVIRPHTLVRRIVIDAGRATAVESAAGERFTGREIVVCCGAITTPPLLVRSGIGPKRTLDALGIDVVCAREGVGARLLDHPASAILLKAKPGTVDPSGALMQTCARFSIDHPNDLFGEPMSFVPWFGGDPTFVAIAASVYRSRGAGRLRVTSADPAAAPVIENDFFADGEDIDLLVAGLRAMDRVARSAAVSEVIEEVVGPVRSVMDDDDELREHLRRFCGSGFHPSGTAPMGREDDPSAVVDQYGRVFGVDGLRVADASIMPTCPRANINIPTIMIGERVGEWLRQELGGA